MSGTPRTDASLTINRPAPGTVRAEEWVGADFARTLERELVTLNECYVANVKELHRADKLLGERAEYAGLLTKAAEYARSAIGDWVQGCPPSAGVMTEAWERLNAALAAPSVAQEPCPFVLDGKPCRCRAGHSGVHVDINGRTEGTWSSGEGHAIDKNTEWPPNEHYEAGVRTALAVILKEPYGCQFCDSGKLRNPAKGHAPDCGFALAEAALNGHATGGDHRTIVFPRATTWPIGGEDFVIDTVYLKRLRARIAERRANKDGLLSAEMLEDVLLTLEGFTP